MITEQIDIKVVIKEIEERLTLWGDQVLNGKLSVGNIPLYMRSEIFEMMEKLEAYKDYEEYQNVEQKVIKCFSALFAAWINLNKSNPNVMLVPIKGLPVGFCLLDVWEDAVRKLQTLDLTEESQSMITTLNNTIQNIKNNSQTQSDSSGCLGSFVIISLVSIASLSGSVYGLYQFIM